DPLRVRRALAAVLAEDALQRCDELGRVRRRHGRTIPAVPGDRRSRLARLPMPDVAASSADALRAPQGGDDAVLLAACQAGAERFFGPDHELWAGEWADPPHPWGSGAERRLAQHDVPCALRRIVRELPIACGAVLALCDLHRWQVSECALALDQTDAGVRAF